MKKKLWLAGFLAGLLLHMQAVMVNNVCLAAVPPDAPKDIKHILGFYYGNGETILIRENRGNLELLYRFSLQDKSFAGANIYPLQKEYFDAYYLYEAGPMSNHEAKVRFQRDLDGYGIACRVGGNTYTRLFLGQGVGDRAEVLRLPPRTSQEWAELRQQAAAAPMPAQLAAGMQATLVPASSIAGVRVENVYATAENLFGAPLYTNGELYLAQEAALALAGVQQELAQKGYGLLLWDAYRPWSTTYLASKALPKDKQDWLPRPEQGSSHNTGLAVDVSLYSLEDGAAVEMSSGFDEPSLRQFSSYAGGTSRQRYLRSLLQEAMECHGFTFQEMEWWHFEYKGIEGYAKLNYSLESLQAGE